MGEPKEGVTQLIFIIKVIRIYDLGKHNVQNDKSSIYLKQMNIINFLKNNIRQE